MNSAEQTGPVLVAQQRRIAFESSTSSMDEHSQKRVTYRSPGDGVSTLFKRPSLRLPIPDHEQLDLQLNTLRKDYCTTLGRLTADANERMAVVKDTDLLKSEVSAEELVALQMLKEWQRTKNCRELKTERLLNRLRDSIQRCAVSEGDETKVQHHQVKEGEWAEFTLLAFETKFFRKKLTSKRTCLQIDAKSLREGALLSVFVSHTNEAPSPSDCQWRTSSPINPCRLVVADSDPKAGALRTYYIAIRCAESSPVGARQSQIRVRMSVISGSQSKRSKDGENGRTLKGIKARLNGKLRAIRHDDRQMLLFRDRLRTISRRHQTEVRAAKHEKLSANVCAAGDLLWSSRRRDADDDAQHMTWSASEDEMLLSLLERFSAAGSRKWAMIQMIMKNSHGRKSARDCNERAAVLSRQAWTQKQLSTALRVRLRKSEMEQRLEADCVRKVEQLARKDVEREQRQQHSARQRTLQPLQRKWLVICMSVRSVLFFAGNMARHRQAQRERKLRVRACVVIQQFVRRKMQRERAWKAQLLANCLRSVLRVCVANREILKYKRAAEKMQHFLETQTSRFSPISVVISNFKSSIMVLQRFARRLALQKASRCAMFKLQLQRHIAAQAQHAKDKRRYRFSEQVVDEAICEYNAQQTREYKRSKAVWLREFKKHQNKRPNKDLVEMILGGGAQQRALSSAFHARKPVFRIKIRKDELDGLLLKAEKFQKLSSAAK